MTHKVEWFDGECEPREQPDPRFPDGMDIDASKTTRNCTVGLPYPARRCGSYLVTCEDCGKTALITTAGRRDDPRSVKMDCGGH